MTGGRAPESEPALDSDDELRSLENTPGGTFAYIRRRLVWTGIVALLCVGGLWLFERLAG